MTDASLAPFTVNGRCASTILRDRWRIATGAGNDQVLIEDVRNYRGICIWVRVSRRDGSVDPHDGSMFTRGQDAGSKAWARLPQYVRRFVEQHGPAMLDATYPLDPADYAPVFNTINGKPVGFGHAIA